VPEQASRWRGECFVFDERVALGHDLQESGLQESGLREYGLQESGLDRRETDGSSHE
jgi:UPF0176 protein